MTTVKNYRLKHAYDQAKTNEAIDDQLGNADKENGYPGSTRVTVKEVKVAVEIAEEDRVVTDHERIALAQAWARIENKVGPTATATFNRAAKKYNLNDPALRTAAPPPMTKPIVPSLLKGRLKEVYDDGPSGGGGLDAFAFTRGKDTYYAVEVDGEYNYALVIGTPDGKVLHDVAKWFGD